MRFGCCGCMVVGRELGEEDKLITGIEVLDQMEHLGFDYIELSMADIMRLSEEEFIVLKECLDRSILSCEVCHNFFPSSIRLTGEDADPSRALDYTSRAFERITRLGTEIIVLGSSRAKNVPKGFPQVKAWQQLVELLRKMDELAGRFGITIVLEPLNKRESNIVNTLEEALELSRQVDRQHIKVLSDYYHMIMEDENADIILEAGKDIRHVHFSEPEGRSFPKKVKASYEIFFQRLKETEYSARVSIEAYTDEFESEALQALELLRSLTLIKNE